MIFKKGGHVDINANIQEFKRWFTKELLLKRELWLSDINEEEASRVLPSIILLNNQSSDPITLHLDSNGGDATVGLIIYDAIRLSVAPITARVCGSANSMASIILQGCKTRIATRHSKLLLHNVRRAIRPKMLLPDKENLYGRVDVESMLKEWESAIQSQNNVVKIYSERTGKSPMQIIEVMNAEKIFTADEAKDFGLIDEVI